MKKWLLPISACSVFGLSLLAHLPARLVIPESSGKFQFVGISGTVWRGSVSKILFTGNMLPVRDLEWSVRPLALLTGTLKADFSEQWTPANSGTVGVSLLSRKIELQELHWQASSRSFGAAVFLEGVKARGDLILDLDILHFSSDMSFPNQVEGRLDWQNAELQFGTQHWQIGAPVVQFSGEGDVIGGIMTNTQPVLPGDGSFQCTIKSCQLELDLQPTPGAPQSVSTGLSLLGLQQTGNNFSGQITLPLE